jgi:hypothetical protein
MCGAIRHSSESVHDGSRVELVRMPSGIQTTKRGLPDHPRPRLAEPGNATR